MNNLAYAIGMIFGVASVVFMVLALTGCIAPSAPWQDRVRPSLIEQQEQDYWEARSAGEAATIQQELDQILYNQTFRHAN